MDNPYTTRRSGGSGRFILIVAGLSFVLGAVGVGYGMSWLGYGGTAEPVEAGEVATGTAPEDSPLPLSAAIPAEPPEDETPVETVERVVEQQGGIDQRLAAAEQRITRLDLQTQAAAGNTARAEGLLIAFAVRRTLERGEKLGQLRDPLQLRFGNAQPNAVEAILAAEANPVTIEQLASRLERITPILDSDANESPLDRFRRELSELFVFRRADSDSPQPEKRIERARMQLQSGQVAKAVSEVEKLPGADRGELAQWLVDARLYERAQQAFDVLENTAIFDPQRLRDAEGERVEQISPAGEL